MTTEQKYLFFSNGPFSNWYKTNFTVDGITFNCTEQYMMYHKAILFANPDIAQKILKENSPREQKALGRKVKNFDMYYWNENAIQIVFKGNHAKFSQNKRLYNMLKNTSPAILVEASPWDKIWGNGLSEEDSKKTPPENWPGTNWLGLTLTEVREFLLSEEAIAKERK